MSPEETRLGRLLAEELGECSDGDLERRIAELDALEASVPDDDARGRAALRTLGDGTRHRLARLLAAADRELCVCELTPMVGVSESAVSHALGDLVEAGLAERREEGRWTYYEATERAERLLAALDATREAPA